MPAGWSCRRTSGPAGLHPPLDSPGTGPPRCGRRQPLVLLPQRLTEITGPLLGEGRVAPADADLTTQHAGEPLGERIIVTGRVLDSDGRPVPDTLIEIWQANAAGRYRHSVDTTRPRWTRTSPGSAAAMTDSEGRYRFVTIKPGAYPWRNHPNAWRPAHIHFSLFGRAFTQRLVTQMYFPGDPLFPLDPIFNSIPDPKARQRLISRFDMNLTEPDWALGYEWDIVLRGSGATVFEQQGGDRCRADPLADRGPVPGDRAAVAGRPVRGARGHARARSRSPGGCWTARERHPGRADRDVAGRTRTAGSRTRTTRAARRRAATRASAASAAARPRRTARYRIVTLQPGPLPSPDGGIEAPHLDVSVFARGLLDRVVTRIYFPDEPTANADDPVLCAIPEPSRRATLIAVPEPEGQLRFDIRLQGERETVFFDV